MVISVPTADSASLIHLREHLLAETMPGSRVILDLKAVEKLTSLEAALLLRLVVEGKKKNIEVRFSSLSPNAQQAFTGLETNMLTDELAATEDLSPVEEVGKQTLELVATGRRLLDLIGELTYWLVIAPWRGKGMKWDRTLEQITKIGI